MTNGSAPTVTRPLSVRLTQAAARRVRAGHPWVFESDLARPLSASESAVRAGAIAALYDARNKLVGIGLYDPDSPIRIRVLGPPGTTPGPELFAQRLDEALTLRSALVQDPETTGYRVLHGPNDGFPGLVLDRYADVGVVKLYSAIWLPWLQPLLRHFQEQLGLSAIVLRASRNMASALASAGLQDGATVRGVLRANEVAFSEHGITFVADPVRGQKTGFFLDQRENRTLVASLARGKRVLNTFSYNGGFSLHALRGGAQSVTSVDISPHAIAAIDENLRLNDPAWAASGRHRGVVMDTFEAFDGGLGKERWDLVIVDPPSFAKRHAEEERAVRAYQRLVQGALRVCTPGGLLVMSSCSSRIRPSDFSELVAGALRSAGKKATLLSRTGHPVDHPVRFAEAEYLKCLIWQLGN